MATYVRSTTLVDTPTGDTIEQAVVKVDTDVTLAFTDLNAHHDLTAAHGATGAVVGTTNTQTLTNKTLTAPTINGTVTTTGASWSGQYGGATNTLTSGATVAINWATGNVQKLTLDHSGITVTFANPQEGARYLLVIVQGAGGSKTITTWPTMKWKDGTAPTLSTTAGRADIIGIVYVGSTYYGLPGVGVY